MVYFKLVEFYPCLGDRFATGPVRNRRERGTFPIELLVAPLEKTIKSAQIWAILRYEHRLKNAGKAKGFLTLFLFY